MVIPSCPQTLFAQGYPANDIHLRINIFCRTLRHKLPKGFGVDRHLVKLISKQCFTYINFIIQRRYTRCKEVSFQNPTIFRVWQLFLAFGTDEHIISVHKPSAKHALGWKQQVKQPCNKLHVHSPSAILTSRSRSPLYLLDRT